MMSDKLTKLNPDSLENVTGGYWEDSTLTEEEQAEMDRLIREESVEGLFDFIQRMNAKYGPSDKDVNMYL